MDMCACLRMCGKERASFREKMTPLHPGVFLNIRGQRSVFRREFQSEASSMEVHLICTGRPLSLSARMHVGLYLLPVSVKVFVCVSVP